MATYPNLVNLGSPSVTVTAKGGQRMLSYRVDGLDPTFDPVVQALGAPGVPYIGAAYPYASGMYCTQVHAEPLGKDNRTNCLITATFSSPQVELAPNSPGYQVKINGTLAKIPYEKDALGQPLQVTYGKDPTTGKPYSQQVKLEVFQPHDMIEFTRYESGSPLNKSKQYCGTVNDDSWQGGDQYTWQCHSISGELCNQQTGLYLVTYTFEYDPDNWQQFYYYQDPINKRIPPDVSVTKGNTNGIYLYTPLTNSFDGLNIPDLT